METHAVRATFALRGVIQLSIVTAVALPLILLGFGLAISLLLGVVGWIVLQPIPWCVEWLLVRRVARRNGRVDSIWFVVVPSKPSQELRRFAEDTRDNPTTR